MPMNHETRSVISEPAYKAARSVSRAIESHFAEQLAAAIKRGEKDLAPEPQRQVIEAIIDTAFWTSLRKEESRSPKISLAFLPPEKSGQPLIFKERLLLTPDILTKLAPAVERSGIHLGVWQDDDEIYIWGTTHTIPGFCFVLEVVEPGLLVIKHRRVDGFGKFVNVAVLRGDEVKIVDERSVSLPDCPAFLTSLLGFTTPASWNDSVNLHVQLAVSMRAHGHGGLLLVVPSDNDQWRESIIHPISYAVSPSFSGLADVMKQEVSKGNLVLWQEELTREIESVAGLTAVDGATIINDRHELLAFGAKITRPIGGETVKEIMVTEPIVDSPAQIMAPGQDGGTRHFAAAQFVYDQRDAFALVASQDGRFTIFSWSPCDDIVHAHRVDTLLL
jgi:hypothetical protein